jgi:hypothetical protein
MNIPQMFTHFQATRRRLKDIPRKTFVLGFQLSKYQDRWYPIPIIQSFISSYYQVCFYCEHCKKFHFHGRGYPNDSDRSGDGHRSPHCNKENSPFAFTGYYLQLNQSESGRTLENG